MSISGIFLRVSHELDAEASPGVTENQVGTAYAMLESSFDDVSGGNQVFAVAFHLQQTDEGSCRGYVVTSHDGVNWQVAAASDTLVEAGELYQVVEVQYSLKYVASIVVTDGATVIYDIDLVSNGQFRLVATSHTPSLDLGVVPSSDSESVKSGRVTVADGTTTKAVTFASPFASSNYAVALAPEGSVGCWISNRTASGFTINTSADPGEDLTVHWMARADD